MTTDTSLLSFILNAGIIVKLVMLILLLASVFSWMAIFERSQTFLRLQKKMQGFKEKFWSGINLDELYHNSKQSSESGALESIFKAGFSEYQRLQNSTMRAEAKLENIDRAMHITIQRQVDHLQKHLNFLATVGSVSPYIGLFGTVWGIMTAFSSLSQVQQATIAMVAPGISEALIATAFGLFAAIPAVIAFNRLTQRLSLAANEMDNFAEELIKILHREVHHHGA
jgi:biopolymer transport protein TolQ